MFYGRTFRGVGVTIDLGPPLDDPNAAREVVRVEQWDDEGVDLALYLARALHDLNQPYRLELLSSVIHYLVDWNAFDDPAPDEVEEAEQDLIAASDRLNRVWERHLHDAAEGGVDVDWP